MICIIEILDATHCNFRTIRIASPAMKSNNTIKLSSSAFKHNDFIPAKYSCDGVDINPPLEIDHLPEGTKCLALIVDDPDAPRGTWVHWVVWNIPAILHLKENHCPGTEGYNDFERNHYGGPCPPSGTHRYYFKIYALDSILNLPKETDKAGLEKAMKKHILGSGELIGLYTRNH
jgi:Raf kinase inhibitor-like YbhB/YbcL family protein